MPEIGRKLDGQNPKCSPGYFLNCVDNGAVPIGHERLREFECNGAAKNDAANRRDTVRIGKDKSAPNTAKATKCSMAAYFLIPMCIKKGASLK